MYPKEGRPVFVDPFWATTGKIKLHGFNEVSNSRIYSNAFLMLNFWCASNKRYFYLLVFKAFMHKKKGNLWLCATIPHPRQQDLTTCGVIFAK